MSIQITYHPLTLPANSTTKFTGENVGGFFCTADGTLTINKLVGTTTAVVVPTFPVVAGTWYDLPFYISSFGGTAVTASGASGVLAQ